MKKNKKQIIQSEPTSNTLYEKIGNKYVPVSEYFTTDYWRQGSYLVQVRPGCRSICRMIWPKSVPEVEAALKVVGEGMINVMRNKATTPIDPKKLTKQQQAALDAWKKAFGDRSVWSCSKQDVIDAGLHELRKYFNEVSK